MVSRRIVSVLGLLVWMSSALNFGQSRSDYLTEAEAVARWIQSTAVEKGGGSVWPADANRVGVSVDLYSGVCGPVLFFLELYESTGNRLYLKQARNGADYLVRWVRAPGKAFEKGLYTGLAGVGFTLIETFQVTGDATYREAARRCLSILGRNAKRSGRGLQWNDSTDIIGGSAGIGLFLLHASRALDDPAALKLAEGAGRRLLELAVPVKGGLKWAMDPDFPRLMPNFSHGTAGVCYFLAALHAKTGIGEFLDRAIAGARYLLSIAETDKGACLIFHHEPGGEDLYYLGWCHGPVGTARLFYRLWQETGDDFWMQWVRRSAQSVIDSGIPERQTPGFWNNLGQCCGSAGVAGFFLDLYRTTRDPAYLEFAEKMASQILEEGKRDPDGLHWVHAEHRTRPEELSDQTGYMQGASGIGLLLLQMDLARRGRTPKITFPDSPF